MTDLEISKALALAIGFDEHFTHVSKKADKLYVVWRNSAVSTSSYFRPFDYRDWNVIGPIAEKYKLSVDFGDCVVWRDGLGMYWYGETPQKSIALAVINGVKK